MTKGPGECWCLMEANGYLVISFGPISNVCALFCQDWKEDSNVYVESREPQLYYLLCSRQPTDGAPFIFWQQGYNFLFHSRISMHRLRGSLNLPFSPPDSLTTMAMFILLVLISLIGLRWGMLANEVDVRGRLTTMYPCKAILVRLSSFVNFSLR